MEQSTEGNDIIGYSYNDQGDLVRKVKNQTEEKIYTYDAENLEVTDYGGTVIQYGYDFRGKRIHQSTGHDIVSDFGSIEKATCESKYS